MQRLEKVVRIILDSERPSDSLRPEVIEMNRLIAESQTVFKARSEHIASGETRTTNGLAESPTIAAMCADDFVRTVEFIRGIHAAIVDIRNQGLDRPVRVLDVGCGPYAILTVPLRTIFPSSEATFTFIDLHAESIESTKSIVRTLGLSDAVSDYVVADACSYFVPPEAQPDAILFEVMLACLETTPQVAIMKNLSNQAPDAVYIPEEVSIDLMFVDPSLEFDLDRHLHYRDTRESDRVPVSTVFVLNRDVAKSWANSCTNRLTASLVRIPGLLEDRFQPMLFTRIRTYKKHVIQEYASGLTHPRRPHIEGVLTPGCTIQFYYELGRHPRLCGEVRT